MLGLEFVITFPIGYKPINKQTRPIHDEIRLPILNKTKAIIPHFSNLFQSVVAIGLKLGVRDQGVYFTQQ